MNLEGKKVLVAGGGKSGISSVKLLRNYGKAEPVLYDGNVNSIAREKDQVKEVKQGLECGITIENFNDIKENIDTFKHLCIILFSGWKKTDILVINNIK